MKVSLSVQSLEDLEKRLRQTAKNLKETPGKIVSELLDIGYKVADDIILGGEAADGNENISLELQSIGVGKGKLNMIGSDVAFQEFGYGLVGKLNPNPKQPPEYQHGQKTEWVFDDNGTPRWSHGMQAQMPMYNASKAIREALPEVCKKIIKEAITID